MGGAIDVTAALGGATAQDKQGADELHGRPQRGNLVELSSTALLGWNGVLISNCRIRKYPIRSTLSGA